jgi:hypothetical protein
VPSTYPSAAALALEQAKQNAFAVGRPRNTLRLRPVRLTSLGTTMGQLTEFCVRTTLMLAVTMHSVQAMLGAFVGQGSNVSASFGQSILGHIKGAKLLLVPASSIENYFLATVGQARLLAAAIHEHDKCIAFGTLLIGTLLGAIFTSIILQLSNMLGYISGIVIGGVINLFLVTTRGNSFRVDE